ncbi:TadE/TadG family type IV pilus assembly protein [Burkholderia ubonensis]|uniref:Pilus assembly protein TadG n=1 Tax=Burkholderia ubonensis TaxID=101571 RepID=A0AA40UUU8_9BURK|nr:TadE/TadG family type IV pilus assembly protein [Burkholderia ubonensis]KVC95486.1 pilus assembly protein TadG [Burkholderia ubonensis]KVC99135.1 pilus assembly protein TadG [Burkholderia ubonensis]KVD33371.1 pilus assembly protein TadG [Burkholderia ubonensis]KVD57248.1 pilus assembly protein TadG [Burkholderia ubonensis]KVP59171.1 pilus assembly protein TadG [Burkholderia ubonensis]
MKRSQLRRSRMRGVAAVEFAFVLIPLVLLVTGVAEFGRAIYQYESLTKSTRNAARYLSTFQPSDPAYPIASAQCLAVYGSETCGASGTELAPGLTTSMVIVCDSAHTTGCSDASDPAQFANVPTYDSNNGASTGTPSGSINLVEVKIKGYKYQPIPAFYGLQAFTFGNIVTVMRQVS